MTDPAEMVEKIRARSLEVGDRVKVEGRRASVVEVLTYPMAPGVNLVDVLLRFDYGSVQRWVTTTSEGEFLRVWNEHGQEVFA